VEKAKKEEPKGRKQLLKKCDNGDGEKGSQEQSHIGSPPPETMTVREEQKEKRGNHRRTKNGSVTKAKRERSGIDEGQDGEQIITDFHRAEEEAQKDKPENGKRSTLRRAQNKQRDQVGRPARKTEKSRSCRSDNRFSEG